jgi:lipoate-protein ligase A
MITDGDFVKDGDAMDFLEVTLPTAEENLALDEALLTEAESSARPREIIRIWESLQVAVVVGRSTRVAEEVNLEACRADGVVVCRRTSGGASVVIGPGCLMYSLVLSYERRPAMRMVDQAHRFVLERTAKALAGSTTECVEPMGTSDLALRDRKFSGNSLRCRRSHLLYHGTLLYDFPLEKISRYLRHPPRQPDYRKGRSHDQFVMNLLVDPARLKQCLMEAWHVDSTRRQWPTERVAQLVRERYASDEWNLRR